MYAASKLMLVVIAIVLLSAQWTGSPSVHLVESKESQRRIRGMASTQRNLTEKTTFNNLSEERSLREVTKKRKGPAKKKTFRRKVKALKRRQSKKEDDEEEANDENDENIEEPKKSESESSEDETEDEVDCESAVRRRRKLRKNDDDEDPPSILDCIEHDVVGGTSGEEADVLWELGDESALVECPSFEPIFGESCSEDLTCSYGMTTCCGTTFDTMVCTCEAGSSFSCSVNNHCPDLCTASGTNSTLFTNSTL